MLIYNLISNNLDLGQGYSSICSVKPKKWAVTDREVKTETTFILEGPKIKQHLLSRTLKMFFLTSRKACLWRGRPIFIRLFKELWELTLHFTNTQGFQQPCPICLMYGIKFMASVVVPDSLVNDIESNRSCCSASNYILMNYWDLSVCSTWTIIWKLVWRKNSCIIGHRPQLTGGLTTITVDTLPCTPPPSPSTARSTIEALP